MLKHYKGQCHCGKIKFEVETNLERVIECNCSFCSKKRILFSFVDKDKFSITEGEELLSNYLFNTKGIRHQFCSNCGVQPFAIGISFPQVGINVSCLADLDIETLELEKYNGKDA